MLGYEHQASQRLPLLLKQCEGYSHNAAIAVLQYLGVQDRDALEIMLLPHLGNYLGVSTLAFLSSHREHHRPTANPYYPLQV